MPAAPLRVSRESARRFVRRALLLDRPAPDIGTALDHLGYVQIDPINVCGRMHDHILRHRVSGYREGGLLRHLHGDTPPLPPDRRVAYEHYLPGATAVLVAFPVAAWPVLASRIRERRLRRGAYGSKLARGHEELARRVIREIEARGPLTSDEIEHDGRSQTGWGTMGRLVKNLLEILLVHGRVLISSRRNFRRVYDLPERVLPAAVLGAPPLDEDECRRQLILLKLRQRRLVALTRAELPLVADLVQTLAVDDCPPLHCLRADLALLDQAAGDKPAESDEADPLLLAPLDPLIYDRRVTAALWDFEYIWEAYTPQSRRTRGYYALPVLAGAEIAGHVDPKADRAAGRLRVVRRSVRRGHRVAGAVRSLAGFLGLK